MLGVRLIIMTINTNYKYMRRNLLFLVLLTLIYQYGTCQFIDKYGINIGTTFSNQIWDYKIMSIDNPAKKYKTGFSAFFSAEKEINKIFSIVTGNYNCTNFGN